MSKKNLVRVHCFSDGSLDSFILGYDGRTKRVEFGFSNATAEMNKEQLEEFIRLLQIRMVNM